MEAVNQQIRELYDGSPILSGVLAVLAVLLLVGVSYLAWIRPYQLSFGATSTEVGQPINALVKRSATRTMPIVRFAQLWPTRAVLAPLRAPLAY